MGLGKITLGTSGDCVICKSSKVDGRVDNRDVVSYLSGNTFVYHRGVIGLNFAQKKVNRYEEIEKSFGYIKLAGDIQDGHRKMMKEANKSLEKMAIEDELTGLYNRRFFDGALEKGTALARRDDTDISLIFFDVDHFKPFNDTYGHKAGDYVLEKLGEVVKGIVRTSDVACRYGGEEFVVILPNTNKEGGYVAAEKIRKAVEGESWVYDGVDLGKVTVSLGVSDYNRGDNVKLFVKRADEAAYAAKKGGRNRTIVSGGCI